MQIHSLADITKSSRHIFLSPHFDDVVFSCGGTLGVQVSSGLRPLIITVFGGIPAPDIQLSPLATQVYSSMGLGSQDAARLVENRRMEDATALNFLQSDYLWLNYLDAIYRGNPAYYTTQEQLIGGDVHSEDIAIDRQLAQDLIALHERLPDTVWYAPLGIGRHVDHQIVVSAVDRLIQRGAKVRLYEDFPYAINEDALENRLHELGGALEPLFVEMSEMLPLREEASDMYASQVQANFGSRAAMYRAMENYTHNIRPTKSIHLERYWTAQ